jgi:hypothetical protein
MIPIHVHTPEFAEPAAPIYHVVASNGVFLVNKTALFTSVTAVGRVPGLLPQDVSLQLSVPPVPRHIMERLWGFFLAVSREWESGEAVAFLHYAPSAGTFRIDVPPQTLYRVRTHEGWRTEARVVYGHCNRAAGFLRLGDAHSHGVSEACFSSRDDADDVEDGLRIVFGGLHRRLPEVRASFVTNGTRFLLRPKAVVEDFRVPLTPPRAWLDQVTCQVVGRSRR